jgi:hypothetical protein
MSSWETTIGATEADQVNVGESLERVLRYKDEEGAARDITGATFEVIESSPASLAAAIEVEILDAAAGTASLTIAAADMASLEVGRLAWFRLKTTFAGGDFDATPRIWIQLT